MYKLILQNYFREFAKLVSDPTDDSIDRLSSGISIYILMAFCALSCSSLYIGNPMQCMAPQNSPASWEAYYSSFCFVKPKVVTFNGPTTIAYYPWVPYFLAFQAILCYLPKFFWDGMKSRFGIDLKTIMKEVKILLKSGNQKKKADEVASYIVAQLRFSYDNSRIRYYSLFGLIYLVKKWMYVINAVFQFCFMASFIGSGDFYWGFTTLNELLVQDPHHSSLIFPRLSTCSLDYFEDNTKASKLRSITCVMGMNVIFEKIYVILYFWILFILMAAIGSASYATLVVLFPGFSQSVIHSYLRNAGISVKERAVLSFIFDTLHVDGLLLIKFVHKAYGPAVSEVLTNSIWDKAQSLQKTTDPVLVNLNKYEAFDPNPKEVSMNNSNIPLLSDSLYKTKNVSYC